jgi:hypothetical protein
MVSGNGEEGIEAVQSSLGITKLSGPGEIPKFDSTSAIASRSHQSLPTHSHSSSSKIITTSSGNNSELFNRVMEEQAEEEKILIGDNAVNLDLSAIRGIQPPEEMEEAGAVEVSLDVGGNFKTPDKKREEQDLEALAELVPGLKRGQVGASAVSDTAIEVELRSAAPSQKSGSAVDPKSPDTCSPDHRKLPHLDSMMVNQGLDEDDEQGEEEEEESLRVLNTLEEENEDGGSATSDDEGDDSDEMTTSDLIKSYEKKPNPNADADEILNKSCSSDSSAGKTHASDTKKDDDPDGVTSEPRYGPPRSSHGNKANPTPYHNDARSGILNENNGGLTPRTPPRDSDTNDESYYGATPSPGREDYHPQSSAASLSTATQSHEVRMPMYLPNFRPATGCTNASDFIVRCFVARLRAGITVVKHGRSRWCKSRLRVLHVHSDGRSLSWKPAQGEPTSNKRAPKLDLSTCLEVRHAWSPDPLNPMFTGTPILRAKCEASNAFKSFALIFPRRTVDITAVTADQCKVLMEGFSALCFRLQVANMAGRNQGMVNAEGGGEGDKEADKMTSSTNPTSTLGRV